MGCSSGGNTRKDIRIVMSVKSIIISILIVISFFIVISVLGNIIERVITPKFIVIKGEVSTE